MHDSDRRHFLKQASGAMAALALVPDLAAHAAGSASAAPLTVALVGAGRQGRAILGELQKMPQVEVAAICDTVESRLSAGLRRARGARGYASHAELLAKEGAQVAAVIVATPTHLHRAVAVDALAAGKHVYCEAPLASTIDDARAIARAARGAAGLFQTGMQGRSNPIHRLARSFFLSGSLRELVAMRAQDYKKQTWRYVASDPADEAGLNWRLDPALTTGLPGEFGTQQFDVFHWFRGDYPVSVRGSGGVFCHKDGREVADTVQCELAFQDGVRLAWQASLANSYEGRYELFSGSMAAIKLAWTHGWMFKEADAPTQGWEVYANREAFHDDVGITLIADATQLASQGKLKDGVGLPESSLWYALADFVKSASEGAAVACGAEEGFRAAVVGIQAQRAVLTGETVAIEPEMLEVGS